MTTIEDSLKAKFGKTTVEIALRLGADLVKDDRFLRELTTDANGRKDEGLLVPCFQHTTNNGICHTLMTEQLAYDIYEDGHLKQEPIRDFHIKALDYLAPGRTCAQLRTDVRSRPQLPWTWEGLIRPGLLSLLVAKSNTGKSALLFGLLDAIVLAEAKEGLEDEVKYLGFPVTPTNVLYFSEEDDETINEKLESRPRLLRSPLIRFETIPYVHQPAEQVWNLVDQAIEEYPALPGMEGRPLLVIVDTLNHFVPLPDENNQFQAHEALMPLQQRAREQRIAGLVTHHVPKALKGDNVDLVQAVRGGSAFVGAADIVMALFRPSPPRGRPLDLKTHHRTLRCQGRNKVTPKPGEPLYLDYDYETGYTLRKQQEGEDGEAPTGSMSTHLGMPVVTAEDDVDRQLIALYNQTPRPTQEKMAKTVKKSKEWVGKRIKTLKLEGKIQG